MNAAQTACPTCGFAAGEADARFCPHDGTPLEGGSPWRDPLVGAVLDHRYRILVRVGEGGFAVVYHARHERLGVDVAVKILRPELAHHREVVARFALEARNTSRIDHDNVVRVMDFGCAGDALHYFVAEYVAGTPLAVELANKGALPPLRAAHVVAQIAAGVGRAHALGIVHRDLKPENVMLTRRGADADFVKVLDFGIAAAPAAGRLTKPGDVLGTPHYMAPEQWSGAPVDARTDVYALGAIVFEMVTGRVPFEGETPAQLLTQHLQRPPPRPTSLVSSLRAGAALDELVITAMAKNPAHRYVSMEAFLAALGRVMSEVGRRSGRVTYSKTSAAPRRSDSLPDATVYQSAPIDVVWDGVTLCEEIRRLHLLRLRRFDELSAVLWPAGLPGDARTIREEADELEERIESTGAEIALLEARLEESWERGREEEARLRLGIIDANLRMAAALERLPPQLLDDAGVRPTVLASDATRSDSAPDEALRRADLELATHLRKQQRDEERNRVAIVDGVARLGALERLVAPLYENLAAMVRRESARRLDLRPSVMAFAQVDGALAAYQSLLDTLESAET